MGAYTLLQDLTVASNSTSVVLNNFGTITKDDFIIIEFTHVNTQGSFSVIKYEPNSANTVSHYHRQTLSAQGSSVGAGRVNDNELCATPSNKASFNISYVKLSENNRLNIFTNTPIEQNSAVQMRFFYSTSSGVTFANGITSFTFVSNITNGIGTGSRIQIYRLDAEKVADITVTSNTTQVDISNLSIDKDSEYLLVSEFINVTGTGSGLLLTPNDLTTNSDYHAQRILGDGSTSAAIRVNTPDFGGSSPNTRNLNYAHIKLSNIGAFTAQSYNMSRYGTSTIRLENWFLSSTAENFTSITKLNIRSGVTNAIGTGSRFTLYKLYE